MDSMNPFHCEPKELVDAQAIEHHQREVVVVVDVGPTWMTLQQLKARVTNSKKVVS